MLEKKIKGYIGKETSGPDQKLFSLSDTLPSTPANIGLFQKKIFYRD